MQSRYEKRTCRERVCKNSCKQFMHLFSPPLQTMAKVITSMLKFPPDQAQKVLEKEDSKVTVSFHLPVEED